MGNVLDSVLTIIVIMMLLCAAALLQGSTGENVVIAIKCIVTLFVVMCLIVLLFGFYVTVDWALNVRKPARREAVLDAKRAEVALLLEALGEVGEITDTFVHDDLVEILSSSNDIDLDKLRSVLVTMTVEYFPEYMSVLDDYADFRIASRKRVELKSAKQSGVVTSDDDPVSTANRLRKVATSSLEMVSEEPNPNPDGQERQQHSNSKFTDQVHPVDSVSPSSHLPSQSMRIPVGSVTPSSNLLAPRVHHKQNDNQMTYLKKLLVTPHTHRLSTQEKKQIVAKVRSTRGSITRQSMRQTTGVLGHNMETSRSTRLPIVADQQALREMTESRETTHSNTEHSHTEYD